MKLGTDNAGAHLNALINEVPAGIKSCQVSAIRGFVGGFRQAFCYADCSYINKDEDCDDKDCLSCFTFNYLREHYGE